MTMRAYNKVTKLFFCTLIFTVSFASLSIARFDELPTKESFIKACTENKSNEFCACHFENQKRDHQAGTVKMLTNRKNNMVKKIQYTFDLLKGFPDVTEANLQKICAETSDYWAAVNVREELRKVRGFEILAKRRAADEVIKTEKVKAEEIFTSYKRSHGMITVKDGHEHDEVRDSFSTHAGSYCGKRNALDVLTKAISDPGTPRFTGRSLDTSPCAE